MADRFRDTMIALAVHAEGGEPITAEQARDAFTMLRNQAETIRSYQAILYGAAASEPRPKA